MTGELGMSEKRLEEARTAYQVGVAIGDVTPDGIQYLVDGAGRCQAVVINLEKWGALWEDFYDVLVSESRRQEPVVPWEVLKAEIAPKTSDV